MTDTLAQAQADAANAKARLGDTLAEIKQCLAPANLRDEAIGKVKARSADLARDAGEAIRERPVTVAAGTLGIVLVVAHRPILRLARKLFSRR